MRNPQFHLVAADYIKSLIRQRRYLIKAGLSKSNPGLINDALELLDKYMRAYHYDTDQKMALFWVKHSSDIYALIPGIHCGTHLPSILMFQTLSKKAKFLLEPNAPWWQPLLSVSPN